MLARWFVHCVWLLPMLIILLGILALPQDSRAQTALPTSFTYQGQLLRNGTPISDTCEFQFALFDAPTGGNSIGSTIVVSDVVSQGYFQARLDFGAAAFAGDARYLEIGVKCSGESTFTTLQGRAALTATPYALHALSVDTDFTDSRYWRLGGNAGTSLANAILGTTNNVSMTMSVSNTTALRLSPTGSIPNLLGGSVRNSAEIGVVGATIGGGGENPALSAGPNRIFDNYGTIGGGGGNAVGSPDGVFADATHATVSGGVNNAASGASSTVSGGDSNSARASLATVGGGGRNIATGESSTVSGGNTNVAGGEAAAIGGGRQNTAGGETATIGGGRENNASQAATVSGGTQNNASGISSAVGGGSSNTTPGEAATVGGGSTNNASGEAATIGGGRGNGASGETATVGGGTTNNASSLSATVGGGSSNNATREASTVSGGRNNNATGEGASVGGGRSNLAQGDYATVSGGGPTDTDDPNTTSNHVYDNYGTVGGGGGNDVGTNDNQTTNAPYGTISGGQNNRASAVAATVGGGFTNAASEDYATIAGGENNKASAEAATVSGGDSNEASSSYATVGGGARNKATGANATVSGGNSNEAQGDFSTVAGGSSNFATADYSFAAGHSALADDQGSFVWADNSTNSVASPAANTFTVRASGGIWLGTTSNPDIAVGHFIDTSTGAFLSSGGDWTNASDRNIKANITPVDTRDTLARLVELPISTWNYKAEDSSTRHMGPMAQDFAAAFGLGSNNTTISTVDASGVALSAIQGLYSLVREKDSRIAALETTHAAQQAQIATQQQQITSLQLQNAALEDRLSALEQRMGVNTPPAESGFIPGIIAVVALCGVGLLVLRRNSGKG